MNREFIGRNVVHVAIQAPYNEGWGYQENLLPHYQSKLGNRVTLITTTKKRDGKKLIDVDQCDTILPDGVRLIRIKEKVDISEYVSKILSKFDVFPLLEQIGPDIILFHGIQSVTVLDVIKYKKLHPECIILADSHLDQNTDPGHGIKENVRRSFFRAFNRRYLKNFQRIYGVTPLRKEYAVKVYGAPENKMGVLLMGGDVENIRYNERDAISKEIREKLNIDKNKFVIITGGKMDIRKKQETGDLVLAISKLKYVKDTVTLLFGVSDEDYLEFTKDISDDCRVINLGWLESSHIYDYFFASDLAVFPGKHSVLWEQAVCAGLPCIFRRINGMDHVDVGGNCRFIDDTSVLTITQEINQIHNNYDDYRKNAIVKGKDKFSYEEIAKRMLTAWDAM